MCRVVVDRLLQIVDQWGSSLHRQTSWIRPLECCQVESEIPNGRICATISHKLLHDHPQERKDVQTVVELLGSLEYLWWRRCQFLWSTAPVSTFRSLWYWFSHPTQGIVEPKESYDSNSDIGWRIVIVSKCQKEYKADCQGGQKGFEEIEGHATMIVML